MTADDPGTLAAAWPLFGLRIHSERLVMRLPTESDLIALISVARAGIHPDGEMPFGVGAAGSGAFQAPWSTRPALVDLTNQAGSDDRFGLGAARGSKRIGRSDGRTHQDVA